MTMRSNIMTDNGPMQQSMQASGVRRKRAVVELGLRTLVKLQQQAMIRAYRGCLSWEGDLEAQRRQGLESSRERQD